MKYCKKNAKSINIVSLKLFLEFKTYALKNVICERVQELAFGYRSQIITNLEMWYCNMDSVVWIIRPVAISVSNRQHTHATDMRNLIYSWFIQFRKKILDCYKQQQLLEDFANIVYLRFQPGDILFTIMFCAMKSFTHAITSTVFSLNHQWSYAWMSNYIP